MRLLKFFLTALLMLILDTSCFVGAQSCPPGSDPVEVICSLVNPANVFTPLIESQVEFLLWTRSNPGDQEYYTLTPYSDASLANSPFNAAHPTYVIIHGYVDYGTLPWILEGKTEILSLGDANVFSIDYRKLVTLDYVTAVCNAYKVAEYSADVFDWLHLQAGLSAARLFLIGHSLGAHLAGIMSFYMMLLSIGRVKRISGLDPAGPSFSNTTNSCRLHKSQADFMDIIHTNGCDFPPCFGLEDVIGHIDFFPNGGKQQPACLEINTICSHEIVTSYWVESIKSDRFISWPCDSWASFEAGDCTSCGEGGCEIMGFKLKPPANGTYYLRTNSAPPYARGSEQ